MLKNVAMLMAVTFISTLGHASAKTSLLGLAKGVALNCENGTIDEVGDEYLSIRVTEDKLELSPYESSLAISKKFIKSTDTTLTIKPMVVTMISEGDKYKTSVSGRIVFKKTAKNISAIYLMTFDGYESQEILTCTIGK